MERKINTSSGDKKSSIKREIKICDLKIINRTENNYQREQTKNTTTDDQQGHYQKSGGGTQETPKCTAVPLPHVAISVFLRVTVKVQR